MAKYGLNKVTLIGNLGKDPELKYLDQGIAFASLWMACTERGRDKDGNYVDRTEWVGVNLWRGQAEIAGKYLRKGSTVCIEGRLRNHSWEGPQGEKRSRLEVDGTRLILLDSRPQTVDSTLNTTGQTPVTPSTSGGGQEAMSPVMKDPNQGATPSSPMNAPELDDLPF